MGTMTEAKHLIKDPHSDNGRTRPRPLADGEPLRMEAIHAEFLDNYHREAHQQAADEDENDDEQQISTPKSEESLTEPRLSETPNTVSEELKASLIVDGLFIIK